MFERISGFFKKFSRRRKQQSGETTIMNGKEPGVDDFGLDDDFGAMDGMDSVGDTDGLGLMDSAESDIGGAVSDFDLGSEDLDITTGGSDFDERTISDEISGGETDVADTAGGLDDMFQGEGEAPDYGEPFAEPQPKSLVKRVLTLVIVFAVAAGAGAAFQIFLWPSVSKMVGMASDEPALDIQTEVNSAQRQQAKLKKELKDFKQIGGPGEVKGMKEQLAQTRDTQGAMAEFQKTYDELKSKEAAYDELIARIEETGTEISNVRGDIANVKSEIEQTRNRVVKLAKQTEEEYERFRLELVRAELSQRLLLELQMEDIESFRVQIAELDAALSRLTVPDMPDSQSTTPEN